MKLLSVSVDGNKLPQNKYDVSPEGLTLCGLPAGSFVVQAEVEIDPTANTSLEGLYYTGGNFCTQCEVGILDTVEGRGPTASAELHVPG